MSTTSHRFDLSWLLSPLQARSFGSEYWASAPLRLTRNQPDFYSEFFSKDDLDAALRTATRVTGAVEILQSEARARPADSYSKVLNALRSNGSIRINSIQHYASAVGRLVRNLEQVLNLSVNVNMYLTPRGGKALGRHYDTHDVFVAQIRGAKSWRLFGPPFLSPMEFLPMLQQETLGHMARFRLANRQNDGADRDLQDEFSLNAGDLLYLPRGFWHEAHGHPEQTSCHLTIGVQTRSYVDLIALALGRAANRHSELRQSLPFAFTHSREALSAVAKKLREDMRLMSELLEPEGVFSDLNAIFQENRMVSPDTSLFGSSGLSGEGALEVMLDSVVRLKDGSTFSLTVNDTSVQLSIASKIFNAPIEYREACRLISLAQPFRPKDLPGYLADSDKLLLVRQLVSQGLLTQEEPGTDTADVHEGTWYPTHIDMKYKSVHWFDFEDRPLKEPFFSQTVSRLIKERPWVRKRHTALSCLRSTASHNDPSGFIFHISRCGSTLLSNALRAFVGTNVFSEPVPISTILEAFLIDGATNDSSAAVDDGTLQGVINSYVRSHARSSNAIIKFTSWNILFLQRIRFLWPEVPCIVVIRDPIEVAVSCLQSPPGWLSRQDDSHFTESILGTNKTVQTMSIESFIARVLNRFLTVAVSSVSEGCRILDYKELSPDRVIELGIYMNLDPSQLQEKLLRDSFAVYSKQASGVRRFFGDTVEKRDAASPSLKNEIEQWTSQEYQRLLSFCDKDAQTMSPSSPFLMEATEMLEQARSKA